MSGPPPVSEIALTTAPDPVDLARLDEGMWRYMRSVLPGIPHESEDVPIGVFARDGRGAIVGGLKANVYWDGLEIDVVWIDEAHRGHGIGTALVGEAETFARARGAVVAFLKTVDARAFYERLGYEVFGVLEDRPLGSVLYHMKKRLRPV